MTRLVRRIAALLAMALWLQVSGVMAQAAPTAADKQRARELYTKGQKLFREGQYLEAQSSFEEAYTAVPNPVVLLSIAECQVRGEQFSLAVATYQRYLDERKDAPDRAQVEAQIAKLQQKPGRLTVESTPSGALVFVDGQDTAKLTPAEIELSSGDHMVAVQIEGFQRAEQSVTIPIGGSERLTFALPEVAKPAVAESDAAPPAEADGDRASTRLPVWIAVGVAGAGVVTGTLLGALALKTRNEFDKNPTEARADKGERLALFSDVGFGVAAAAGVTALVLYLTAGKGEAEATASTAFTVAPAIAERDVGLTGTLRF
jgi:tetratricopeptide (TPR) repeat protein